MRVCILGNGLSSLTLAKSLVNQKIYVDVLYPKKKSLVNKTRPSKENKDLTVNEYIEWGAGPRASQCLIMGAKARAALDGRPTPDIEDVKSLALPVLRHRILPNFNAEAEGMKVDDIITQLLE